MQTYFTQTLNFSSLTHPHNFPKPYFVPWNTKLEILNNVGYLSSFPLTSMSGEWRFQAWKKERKAIWLQACWSCGLIIFTSIVNWCDCIIDLNLRSRSVWFKSTIQTVQWTGSNNSLISSDSKEWYEWSDIFTSLINYHQCNSYSLSLYWKEWPRFFWKIRLVFSLDEIILGVNKRDLHFALHLQVTGFCWEAMFAIQLK